MDKTVWKSHEEIKYSLGAAKKVAIISCSLCANMCDTGGMAGIRAMNELLDGWGKKVTLAKCVLACCSVQMMMQALRKYSKALSKSDALVILSCPAGVRSAILHDPGVPVVAVLDSVGSAPIWRSKQEDPVLETICTACGQCVITYTAGICPVSVCPANTKYGPCSKAPQNGTQCALDKQRNCVWSEIIKRGGDLASLRELERIHKTKEKKRISAPKGRNARQFLRKFTIWLELCCAQGLARLLRSIT